MFVFGLDLNAIRFGAFKSSRMFDKRYYLRRDRFVVYQIAMIFTVVGECMATNTLDKYLQLQNQVSASQPGASMFNNDIVGAAGFTIFAGVYTACVFGTMFFFLLFWPALPESILWSRIKYGGAISAAIFDLGAALTSTIIIASHSAYLIPSPTGSFDQLQQQFNNPNPPFQYRQYGFCIAWLVLFWIGTVASFISIYYVFKAARFHLANPHVVGTYTQQPDTDSVDHESPKRQNGTV